MHLHSGFGPIVLQYASCATEWATSVSLTSSCSLLIAWYNIAGSQRKVRGSNNNNNNNAKAAIRLAGKRFDPKYTCWLLRSTRVNDTTKTARAWLWLHRLGTCTNKLCTGSSDIRYNWYDIFFIEVLFLPEQMYLLSKTLKSRFPRLSSLWARQRRVVSQHGKGWTACGVYDTAEAGCRDQLIAHGTDAIAGLRVPCNCRCVIVITIRVNITSAAPPLASLNISERGHSGGVHQLSTCNGSEPNYICLLNALGLTLRWGAPKLF